MALDVRHRVRADRHHRHAALAQIVQHAGDEPAAVALAFVLAIDLGVLEQDRPLADPIVLDEADLLAPGDEVVAARAVVGELRFARVSQDGGFLALLR